MAYIASENIYMFPVANRGAAYPLSRLTTEQNMVNIVRSVSDKDGFVISKGEISSNDNSFEFIINSRTVEP